MDAIRATQSCTHSLTLSYLYSEMTTGSVVVGTVAASMNISIARRASVLYFGSSFVGAGLLLRYLNWNALSSGHQVGYSSL